MLVYNQAGSNSTKMKGLIRMQTECLSSHIRATGLVVALLIGLAQGSLAQTNGFLPVVTIRATDPLASWSGDTGTFTVFREGATNATLNVFYRIDGTASNGVDYATIGNTVMIPAGARTNSITISPINNGQTNTKTVSLTLAPPPWVPPVNYEIGYPSNATVYIAPTTSNLPPSVTLFFPTNGAVFTAPVDIRLVAAAHDPEDGYNITVEFFAGTNDLGPGTF